MPELLSPLDAAEQGNPGIWFETQTKIRNGKGRLETPRMNILQRRINAVFIGARRKGKAVRVIGLKPRKRGFSTMVGAINYTECCKHNFESVIVGNKLETSATVFGMMTVFSQNDGLKGKWGSAIKATTETLKWAHGSVLAQSTAKNGDSIRGQTPQFVHGTEVAHWEQQDSVFLALMNAIPDDPMASVFLESTPNGATGAYYQRWTDARWPTPDECPDSTEYWRYWETHCPDQPDSFMAEWEFVRVFAAWFEFEEARIPLNDDQRKHIRETLDSQSWYVGEKDLIAAYGNKREADGRARLGNEVEDCDMLEQLAWRRMIIRTKCDKDPRKFDQEYPRDPDSCFLASGTPYFDTDCLTHLRTQVMVPTGGNLIKNKGTARVIWLEDPDGGFSLWEKPKIGCAYLIALDTAEGEDQAGGDDTDRHSALVIRRAYVDGAGIHHRARVVARIGFPCKIPIYSLAAQVDLLSRYFGRCIVAPEMNNSGLAYIVAAQILGTPIWKRVEFDPKTGKTEERHGWRTTDNADYSGLRTLILSNLHQALREGWVDIHCTNLIHELSKFARVDGKLQGNGAHDDDVMCLAIGLYVLDAATVYEEQAVYRDHPADLKALMEGLDESSSLAMRT